MDIIYVMLGCLPFILIVGIMYLNYKSYNEYLERRRKERQKINKYLLLKRNKKDK